MPRVISFRIGKAEFAAAPVKIDRRKLYGWSELKTVGRKVMVLKFTGWKTNKGKSGEWPAYVLHITNFSSDRLQRLQREVDITDDERQLYELRDRAIEINVKKGWEKVPEKV